MYDEIYFLVLVRVVFYLQDNLPRPCQEALSLMRLSEMGGYGDSARPLLIQVIPLDSSPWCNPFTALHAFWSACMGCERYVAPGCVGDSAYVFQLEREFIRPLFQSFYYIQLNIFTHFIRRYKDTILDILTYNLTWKKDIRRSEVI
jgi:hypothetical protein